MRVFRRLLVDSSGKEGLFEGDRREWKHNKPPREQKSRKNHRGEVRDRNEHDTGRSRAVSRESSPLWGRPATQPHQRQLAEQSPQLLRVGWERTQEQNETGRRQDNRIDREPQRRHTHRQETNNHQHRTKTEREEERD